MVVEKRVKNEKIINSTANTQVKKESVNRLSRSFKPAPNTKMISTSIMRPTLSSMKKDHRSANLPLAKPAVTKPTARPAANQTKLSTNKVVKPRQSTTSRQTVTKRTSTRSAKSKNQSQVIETAAAPAPTTRKPSDRTTITGQSSKPFTKITSKTNQAQNENFSQEPQVSNMNNRSHSRHSFLMKRASVNTRGIADMTPTLTLGMTNAIEKLRLKDLKVVGPLGQGAVGSVYLVQERASGFFMALKVMKREFITKHNLMEQIIREVNNQFPLRHPNIIRTYDYYYDNDQFYILQEIAHYGQLFDHIKTSGRFCEAKAAKYTAQLADALLYLRMKNVIHRDLKPENLMLDNHENIKLSDFGWSICLSNPQDRRRTYCGTLDYFAPEMVEQLKYSFGVDYWALGVIIFEMITGKPPFETSDKNSTIRRISNRLYDPPPYMSDLAKNLVDNLLQIQPKNRLTPDQVLQHPWIKLHCPEFKPFTEFKIDIDPNHN